MTKLALKLFGLAGIDMQDTSINFAAYGCDKFCNFVIQDCNELDS